MRESKGMPGKPTALIHAYALAYAMQQRPTMALATKYFDALKRMLEQPDSRGNNGGLST